MLGLTSADIDLNWTVENGGAANTYVYIHCNAGDVFGKTNKKK